MGGGEHRAEGEHPVVIRDTHRVELVRRGHRAVVRVVEQKDEASAAGAPAADGAGEGRVGPFVDQHQVDAVERRVEVERLRVVEPRLEMGEAQLDVGERGGPLVGQQVLPAPPVGGLEDREIMAAPHELARDAAHEVRVAVVPVREDGVAEQRDPHSAGSRRRAGLGPPVRAA